MNKAVPKKSTPILIIKTLLVSYILTLLILVILSFFMLKLNLSASGVRIGITLSYILSAFVGGVIIGKNVGQKKFLWGIMIGVLYFAVIFIVSMVLNKGSFSGAASMITVFAMCTLGGMLGGMVS